MNGPLRRTLRRLPHGAVRAGLPPAMLGWRWVESASLDRDAVIADGGRYRSLAAARVERNPLPVGVVRAELPTDPGWWGYAFADVPMRLSTETALATLKDARLVFHTSENGDHQLGLLASNDRALTTREVVFRPHHAEAARTVTATVPEAVWICERVYHNYSHWLTAHAPKLSLLVELGLQDRLVMPRRTTPFIERSLELAGLDPAKVRRVDAEGSVRFGSLSLFVTDRFRPDLLRRGGALLREETDRPATRRVYVTRREARARKLLDEEEVWPLFRDAGFERVAMESLSFDEQRRLMAETAVLAGPHGAGLTNQVLCPEGGTVIEMADPLYPNPNFYAVACAMGHRYALVEAGTVGDGHRLYRDLTVQPSRVARCLESLGL